MVTEITMGDMLEPLPYQDNIIRIVMFYGETCGPCNATKPNYELISDMFENLPVDIRFFKINAWHPVEQKDFISTTYGISGVPHFKVFFRGEAVHEKIGGGDAPTMRKFVYDAIEEVFKRYGDKQNES